MSDRLYVDPVTNSVREERALFAFSRKLGKTSGQFYRLGVLTYCRVLIETGTMPETLTEEYKAISEKDRDYLERLMEERIVETNDQYEQAARVELPKPPEPAGINWDTIPDEQKVKVYIQTIFSPDERKGYIDQYLSAADEDEQTLVMTQFVDGFVTRFTQDVDRPFSKADLGGVRRVLRTWAGAKGGV